MGSKKKQKTSAVASSKMTRKEVQGGGDDDDPRNGEPNKNNKKKLEKQPENKSKKIRSGMLSREQTCDMISELSESIMEDPTKAFSSPDAIYKKSKKQQENGGTTDDNDNNDKDVVLNNKATPSPMQQLLQIARHYNGNGSGNGDDYISRLGIMSLLVIYKDLIPSYRIRLPTAAEMSVKVGLDTKRLWDYERSLLTNYQQYLKLLETIWNYHNKKTKAKANSTSSASSSTLAVTAMLCMCELLKSAFHFNFRSNLLTMVMRQINNGQIDEVSSACCVAVEHVFRNDSQGEVALEATRLLAKAIKDRNFKVRTQVLRTFLALPLRVHIDEAQAAKLATAAKKRKRDKDLKEIDKELQEGDATVDKILLARCQSDTLQTVTVTYFRILKSDNLNSSTHMKEVLPACLEGLAKFAHLVNIDTVMDLLEVLKGLLKDIDALPLDAALNCVLTAFQTLSGPGREMKIDQKEYISPLYTQLPRLIGDPNIRTNTSTMLKCLEAAFIKRREYSTTRIAAFLKQILTVAMVVSTTSPSCAVPLIAFARQLFQRYPASSHQLLENEQDAITSGQYCPDVEEPELSNPFSTSAWELATLKFHCHPRIESQSQGAATLKMLQMPAEDPDRLLDECTRDEEELYCKFRRSKRKHPLKVGGGGGNDQNAKKKQRRSYRFLQSSSRKVDHLSQFGVFLK